MKMTGGGLRRVGGVLVLAGLTVQVVTAFLWSPGTFIVSAAIGAPLVILGAIVAVVELARAPKGEQMREPSASSTVQASPRSPASAEEIR